MDLQLYELAMVVLITLAGSYLQSVTGFGFGIIAMIFLPRLLLYTEANVLASILSTLTSALVVISMYRKINWRNLFFPLLGSTVANYLAISFVKSAKNETLILILGVALFLLSIYFFFYSERIKIRPTWYAGLFAGMISGVMSGLFSISGPPMVIYYMQSEKQAERYLATISSYFVLSGMITVSMKALSGFVTANVLIGVGLGVVGMIVGAYLGRLTRGKMNPQLIRKVIYGVMACSGIINVVTALR